MMGRLARKAMFPVDSELKFGRAVRLNTTRYADGGCGGV